MNQDGVKSGYYAQVRPEIARLIVGQPKRILEVGCANGLFRTYLRFFTPKSLRRLFDECGFKVEVLKPSGPDRFRWIKKLMAPFFWIMGVDVLYMQIAFRVVPHPMKG